MSSSPTYRVGLVGLGGRGSGLARIWHQVPNAQLVAVADLTPERLAAAPVQLGDVACYADHRAMLEGAELDVLTVATRGQHHAQIVVDAVERGVRGVYVEKPFACSLADADRMIEACRASDTVLVMGHQRRWMEQIVSVRDAIRDGAIGLPTHGQVFWPTGRVGSNGTHFFDAINFILDSTPVEVVGRVKPGLDLERVEDHPRFRTVLLDDPGAMGIITYANGARIAIDCMSDVLLPYSYSFCGTRGRIDFDEISWQVNYAARDADIRNHSQAWAPLTPRPFPLPPYVDDHAEAGGYTELLKCIETGATPTSSGEDGRVALETIVAFHRSSAAGMRPVRLPLGAEAYTDALTMH